VLTKIILVKNLTIPTYYTSVVHRHKVILIGEGVYDAELNFAECAMISYTVLAADFYQFFEIIYIILTMLVSNLLLNHRHFPNQLKFAIDCLALDYQILLLTSDVQPGSQQRLNLLL